MKSIGFNNFRKFSHFEPIQLGAVNFLVGRNNAGKSTVVKAIMLLMDNLKYQLSDVSPWNSGDIRPPHFAFDADYYHNVHIETFDKALYNEAKTKAIVFSIGLRTYDIELTVVPAFVVEESMSSVVCIKINDTLRNIQFKFDFNKRTMSVELDKEAYNPMWMEQMQLSLADATERLADANDRMKKAKEAGDAVRIADIQVEIKKLKEYKKSVEVACRAQDDERVTITADLDFYDENTVGDSELALLVRAFANYAQSANPIHDKRTKEYANEADNRKILLSNVEMLETIAEELNDIMARENVEYIHAHAATQKHVLSKEDKNDYDAMVVHNFYREGITQGSDEYEFIRRWMDADHFDIGEDFHIIQHGGEAYEVKITGPGKGKDGVDLADMGMGSCQLMIMLLQLATLLHQYKDSSCCPTIIVEEPEQNLHPSLQSKLAKLFAEVSELPKKYHVWSTGFQFIVETHSEYLIRRTQVMVAEEGYKDEEELRENNPFHVFYFDGSNAEEPYYEMEYDCDGFFKEDFGSGFFDEASNNYLILLRNRKAKQNV